jgi:hypothetical protein
MPRLTRAQARIIAEIDEVTDELGLGHRTIVEKWEGSEHLTTLLGFVRRELVAAAIVHEYTYIDELLGSIIARYFLGAPGGRRAWRTRRFRRFNYFILEKLYVVQKLALVRDIRPLSRESVRYIEKINDLRNAVAHAYFPENLRGERTTYKGLDVFTIEGFRALRADRDEALEPLFRRAVHVRS